MMRTTAIRKTREVHTSIGATNNTIEFGNSVGTDSESHDPKESEPRKLKGKIRCTGAVAEETNNDPK